MRQRPTTSQATLAIFALLAPVAIVAQSMGVIGGTSSFANFNLETGVVGPLLSIANPYSGQFAVSKDGSTLYMPSGTLASSPNEIDVVSASTGSLLNTITAIHEVVRKIILSADESTLYALGASEYVYKVDLSSGLLTGRATFPNLVQDLAISPDQASLYVSVYPQTIYAVSTSNMSQNWNVAGVSAGQLSVSQNGQWLYISGGVVGPNANRVSVVNTQTHAASAIPIPDAKLIELATVIPHQGHHALVFSILFAQSPPYSPEAFVANIMDTATNQFVSPFLLPVSDGYVPGFQKNGAFFVPIQFAPDGKSLWLLATCVNTNKCVSGTWQLEGFTFPGGKQIGSTILPGVLNVIGMPR